MKASVRLWKSIRPQRRTFSTTSRRLDNYAFIGLGQMGFQMARNLQHKLSPSDTVRLYDINKDAMEKLAQEMRAQKAGGAAVQLAETAADAIKEAVCTTILLASSSLPCI
jgi:3-hydroxyisobutyrate dehydrogenase-like beta-hydroxyacid dehydrogenase